MESSLNNNVVQRRLSPAPCNIIRRVPQQPWVGATNANRDPSQQPRTGGINTNRGLDGDGGGGNPVSRRDSWDEIDEILELDRLYGLGDYGGDATTGGREEGGSVEVVDEMEPDRGWEQTGMFDEGEDEWFLGFDQGENPLSLKECRVRCLEEVKVLSGRATEVAVPDGKCTVCLRVFKGKRGLAVHRARSDCGKAADALIQRSPIAGGNPSTIVGQQPHEPCIRVTNTCRYVIEEETAELQKVKERLPVKWPGMAEKERWKVFDGRVSDQLPPNMSWTARLNLLQEVVYDEGVGMFGCVEPRVRQPRRKSRREVLLGGIRDDIRQVAARLKVAPGVEKYGLEVLLHELKERRRVVRRAENARNRRVQRKKLRKAFIGNPFQASKEMLSPRVQSELNVSKEVLDEYVRGVASDPDREKELGELAGLPDPPAHRCNINKKAFLRSHFLSILKRKKGSSRPGPNQISYKVYKLCERVREYLFEILNAALRAKVVPLCWRVSDGIMIPKVASPDPANINDYRQIALLNVEGKLFWALVAERLYGYLVRRNLYVSPSIQKGSMKKVAGCWEHTAMVWSALKDARKSKKSLSLLWLDLANAYGSVPHKLIVFALKRYRVPDDWIDLIMAYYDGLWGRTSASGISSDWKRYERGIFAGCTISVILFVAAFNVILEYVDVDEVKRYKVANGNSIELLRGFMDDVSILTSSVAMAKIALRRTEVVVAWARMKLKPVKSRSLVVHNGRCMDVEPFEVNGEVIPSLQRKNLRTLGRVFDCSLSDRHCKAELELKVKGGLKKLDKCVVSGYMKLWALHHILLPQVRWDLMVYELPLSFIERVEKVISVFIRKWLGVSRNLTSVALYSKKTPCPLPFQSLVGLFKSTKVNSHLQLMGSYHREVVENVTPSDTGKKWQLCKKKVKYGLVVDIGAIRRCIRRVEVERMVGEVRSGRGGLGLETAIPCAGSERQRQVAVVREEMEDEYLQKAVRLRVQGRWTMWKDFNQRVISWKSLFYADTKLERFCIGSTFNTLASPSNLKRWGMAVSGNCSLCDVENCTIAHVLSGCAVGLGQGRYRYRHDSVLREICHHLAAFINNLSDSGSAERRGIRFVREGAKGARTRTPSNGILHGGKNWVFLSDLGKRLVFPRHVFVTDLRPDVVIYSNHDKVVIMVELTCPCEENFDARHEEKLTKYDELKEGCVDQGWRVHLFAVEVGARGYTAQTLSSCLKVLGLPGKLLRRCLTEVGNASLRASFWVWMLREKNEWS